VVDAAMRVTDEFMATFNARDAAGHAGTLAYPHVRLASGTVLIWGDIDEAIRDMGVAIAALTERLGWHHSEWDRREVIHAGEDKVHLDVAFTRYQDDGSVIAKHEAIYVVERADGGWGIRCRSSFAP
jgi:hypothetical protein